MANIVVAPPMQLITASVPSFILSSSSSRLIAVAGEHENAFECAAILIVLNLEYFYFLWIILNNLFQCASGIYRDTDLRRRTSAPVCDVSNCFVALVFSVSSTGFNGIHNACDNDETSTPPISWRVTRLYFCRIDRNKIRLSKINIRDDALWSNRTGESLVHRGVTTKLDTAISDKNKSHQLFFKVITLFLDV